MEWIKNIAHWLKSTYEELLLIILALYGIAILVLHEVRPIDPQNHFPEWAGVMLALMAVALVARGVEARRSVKDMDQKIGEHAAALDSKIDRTRAAIEDGVRQQAVQTIDSLHGIRYVPFASGVACIDYLAKRIREARKSVDDLTWITDAAAADRNELEGDAADSRYCDAIIATAGTIKYREIFVFTDAEKYAKLSLLIGKNLAQYNCAYFEPSDVPRPAFTIIDGEEIVLYAPPSVYCSIRHAGLLTAFRQYFTRAWGKARKIKDGGTVDQALYDEIMSKCPARSWPQARSSKS